MAEKHKKTNKKRKGKTAAIYLYAAVKAWHERPLTTVRDQNSLGPKQQEHHKKPNNSTMSVR